MKKSDSQAVPVINAPKQRNSFNSNGEQKTANQNARQRKSKSASIVNRHLHHFRNSPRGSVSVDDSDSNSDRKLNSCESLGSMLSQRANPWAEFTEYVKSIDVDSMYFQQKKFNDKKSTDFKSVMSELEGEMSSRHTRNTRNNNSTATPGKIERKLNTLKVENTRDSPRESNNLSIKDVVQNINKRRQSIKAWAAVAARNKPEVHKSEMKPKDEPTRYELQTAAAKHKDPKQVLYQRYIYERDTWAQGLSQKNYPQFLLDREREKGERKSRPKTAANVKWRPENRPSSSKGNARKGRPKSSYT